MTANRFTSAVVTATRRSTKILALAMTAVTLAACATGGRPTETSSPPATSSASPGHPTWSPWPMALHDARHSGSSVSPGPTAGALRWQRQLEGAVTPGPVIGPDGTIYAASNGGVLHALNPSTGADLWTYDSGHTRNGDDLSVSPLVLPDGMVLWPTPGRELLAVSPAGTKVWSLSLPGQPTSPASTDGRRVYVGDTSGAVTAIDIAANDQPVRVWTVQTGSISYGSVVTAGGGRLYTTADSSLIAIDDGGAEGHVAWQANPGDDITEVSAGVAVDGTALLGTNGTQEWAYRADGTPLWHSPRIITYSSPSITDSGLAYVGDHSGTVHVLRVSDGSETAAYRHAPDQIWSSTIVDSDQRVYYGSQSGHVIGLDADGAALFDVDVGAPIDSYPALTGDANLIVGARNGTLSAIG